MYLFKAWRRILIVFNGPFPASFSLFLSFHYCCKYMVGFIKFAGDWIRTVDLLYFRTVPIPWALVLMTRDSYLFFWNKTFLAIGFLLEWCEKTANVGICLDFLHLNLHRLLYNWSPFELFSVIPQALILFNSFAINYKGVFCQIIYVSFQNRGYKNNNTNYKYFYQGFNW